MKDGVLTEKAGDASFFLQRRGKSW
jgi:hypothetical protein